MEGSFVYVPNKINKNGLQKTPNNTNCCCDHRKRYNFVKQSCKCCCFCVYYPLTGCSCFRACGNCLYYLVLDFLEDINKNIFCCNYSSNEKKMP